MKKDNLKETPENSSKEDIQESDKIIVKSMEDFHKVREFFIKHRQRRKHFARAFGHPIDGRIGISFKNEKIIDIFGDDGKLSCDGDGGSDG